MIVSVRAILSAAQRRDARPVTRRTLKPQPAGRKAPRLAVLRRLLSNIVESSSDVIFSRKLDCTINTWNAAAERIFSYGAQDTIGRSSIYHRTRRRCGGRLGYILNFTLISR